MEDVDQFEANDDEHWRAIHNFRCQRAWDFFHESATAFTLMLVLQTAIPDIGRSS